MNLTWLRAFEAVAQAGSVSAAARRLRVSQPSLSVSIQNLEAELGTTLLLRTSRGVVLTDTGRALLEGSQAIFQAIEAVVQRVRDQEEELCGRFVIGCHEPLGAYFLPALLPSVMERAPGIEVTLWNGPSRKVWEAVLDHQVQFGLVVNPLRHDDLVLVDLFPDEVALFVSAQRLPAGSPGAALREEEAAWLRRGPLIYAGRVEQSQQIVDALAERDLLASRHLSCGDLELVKSLTLGGVGVGILPRRVAQYHQEGRLREIHPSLPRIQDRIALIYRADLHRTRAAMWLKDALLEGGRGLDQSRRAEGVGSPA
jgi:DNA-binding transcriptional LysR family regulator